MRSAIGDGALAAAMAQHDPDSVAAATALRRAFAPEIAAVALEQASLRRRARAKFGDLAAELFFTPDGLEQATRPEVAAHRAHWLAERGVRSIVDLGCGIGVDARAYLAAGLAVTAVEWDHRTAEVAELNLGQPVLRADVATQSALLADPDTLAYCDPARRTVRGRSWDPGDLSPSWEFLRDLLRRGACLKLGPGFPRSTIPPGCEARWVAHRRQAVELTLYTGPGARPDTRTAVVLGDDGARCLAIDNTRPLLADAAPRPGDYLSEPDPAVLAAGGVDTLASHLDAVRISAGIGYLVHHDAAAEQWVPFVTSFEVAEVLPFHRKALRAWVRDRRIGRLEIKKRGVDVDPAALRRELKPRGEHQATWILTPTVDGSRVLVVNR